MRKTRLVVSALGALALGACVGAVPEQLPPEEAFPKVEDVTYDNHGKLAAVSGDLGEVAAPATLELAKGSLGGFLGALEPVLLVKADDLVATDVRTDAIGMTHVRFGQMKDGLTVVGGELIVHVSATGNVKAITTSLRDGLDVSSEARITAGAARSSALAGTAGGVDATEARLTYVVSSVDGLIHLAWETTVTGELDGLPVVDRVYVSAASGAIVDRHPQIHTARNRRVYSGNNSSSLPGSIKRTEGGAATGDTTVDMNYDALGVTYDCYSALFNRDSFSGGGATLTSTVHHRNGYANAFWDGSQMVYGDGDGSQMGPLGRSQDVTVHELTHAVTQYEANLVYSYEPGALNEGMSDIMSAVCDVWKAGNITTTTWLLADDIWTPGQSGDAMRYMANPTQDGYSRDYYPERLTGSSDNGGVHGNSGIANLAFKLLVTGGSHPRGKTSVVVPGIGMTKAAQIFYRALTIYMGSNTSFSGARTACKSAAQDLYGSAEAYAVEAAWAAVGVGQPPTNPNPDPDPDPDPTPDPDPDPAPGGLTNGQGVTFSGPKGSETRFHVVVPAGATGLKITLTGTNGDPDIYVKKGAEPTRTSWDYRPYNWGANETVTPSTSAGTWHIMVHGYTAYSNVTLKATWN